MRPDIKSKLTHAFQLAFDAAENATERDKLYKTADSLGIKLDYMNENFKGLKNLLS